MIGHKRIRKSIVCMLLICSVLLPISGYLAYGQTVTEQITVAGNVPEEQMRQYLRSFHKKNPGIAVEYRYYSDYESDMQRDLERDQLCDVMFIPDCMQAGTYADHLEVLGSYSKLRMKYNYVDMGVHEGDIVYGIPSLAYMSGILYNEEVFNKAGITETPTSISEFLEDLRLIREHTDAVPFYTNYQQDFALQFWEIFPYLEMTGDSNDKYGAFLYKRNPFSEGSAHAKVYGLLYDIAKEGLCEDADADITWDNSKAKLNHGEIGCIAIGSWALKQFKDAGSDSDNVRFMPFPNEIDGRQYVTISTNYNYAIAKGTAHKEAARAYIDFMLDESGYALDQETISVVRSDPIPESYGDMSRAVLTTNSLADGDSYAFYQKLSSKLTLPSAEETRRIIDAGRSGLETFTEIMADWNRRWESSRPEDMPSEDGYRREPVVLDDLTGLTVGSYEVELSQSEQAYLTSLDQVSVGYMRNLAPISYEKKGKFAGLGRRLLDEIGESCGISFVYHGYDNYDDMLEGLASGEITMIAAIDASHEGGIVRVSKSYLSYLLAIVKNDMTSLEQLEQKKLAAVNGREVTVNLEELGISEGETYLTLQDALRAVDQRQADYLVANYYSADYYIKDLEIKGISMVPLAQKAALCLGYREDVDPQLVSICNKYLYAISDNKVQMMLTEELDPPAKRVTIGRLVRENPWQAMLIVIIVLMLFATLFYENSKQKWKHEQRHLVDVRRYEILESLMDEYVFEVDYEHRVFHFGEKFSNKFGVPSEVAIEGSTRKNDCLNAVIDVCRLAQGTTEFESEPFSILEDGVTHFYRMNLYMVENEGKEQSNGIGKITNIDKEIRKEQQAMERAVRDPLTHLYNRAGFTELLTDQLRQGRTGCFFIADLDNFKSVNDHLGHLGGDFALTIFADCLQDLLAKQAIVGRFGGDEFIGYLYGRQPQEVEVLLEQLVEHMRQTMVYEGKTHQLSISLGAIYTRELLTQEELLQKADEQLYQVKKDGKNQYRLEEL